MNDELINYVAKQLDAKQYYESQFDDIRWPTSGGEARVCSPFRRNDDTPSLLINPKTGAWFDHGSTARTGGNSVVSFHAKLNGITVLQAARELYHQHIRPIVPDKRVRHWHRQLLITPSFMRYTRSRFVTDSTTKFYNLGSNGQRILIPIRDEFGCVVNVRMYDPTKQQQPKMLNYTVPSETRQFGTPPMLFPISILSEKSDEPIFICEGEWDTLALISMGLIAVTTTAGCKSWPQQYNHLFTGRWVVIVYDNDDDGKTYSSIPINQLSKIAKRITKLDIPTQVGKDVSDWLRNDPTMRSKEAWLAKAVSSVEVVVNPDEVIKSKDVDEVPLDRATHAEYLNRLIRIRGLVTGKELSPYLLPKVVRFRCTQSCEDCVMTAMKEKGQAFREIQIRPDDPILLTMMDATNTQVNKMLLELSHIDQSPACDVKVEVVQAQNTERLFVIPTLDDKSNQYVLRTVVLVSHGLRSNRSYTFTGITTTDPRTQQAVHLCTQAVPTQDEIESFTMTSKLKRQLRRFASRQSSSRLLMSHLHDLASWFSKHVTKIKQRDDLHIIVDLAFHSLTGFEFNGEIISRGMLDVLVIGDTRCGKGFVAERLAQYYGVGEVASGENCSFAGLIGGCDTVGKQFIIKWGLIPINNGRLVIIDEASSLSEGDFARLSRVRSEGIAEIAKIVRERTQANTRLIWLSNTRSGRPIMSYGSGIAAIKELVGANEDISRFDLAVTVAHNEVPGEIINSPWSPDDLVDFERYPSSLCRSLVMWAWSRKPNQVKFTKECEQYIINAAIQFGKQYAATIPLIQVENARVKIAKIAAAIAARTFNCDESGEIVNVELIHAECACTFMRMVFNKTSMGYDVFSASSTHASNATEKQIDDIFKSLEESRQSTIQGMATMSLLTAEGLTDYTGDMLITRDLLSRLVRLGCVTRAERNTGYLKSTQLNSWLRAQLKTEDLT